MKKINFKRGFTLIELLVVVAIIGILTSVVLVMLNSARARGADAAIKANLVNASKQGEIYYTTNGNYGTVAKSAGTCTNTTNTLFADPIIWGQISAAKTASGGLYACVSDITSGGSWAAIVQLKQNATTEAWCVDSSGQSKKETLDGTPSPNEFKSCITDDFDLPKCSSATPCQN